MGLGKKLKKGFRSIGKKLNDINIHELGKKTMDVIDKVDKKIDKGLSYADDIAMKAGGVTNAIKKGTAIADKVIKTVEASGLANTVPWGQQAISTASKISGGLRKGAETVDHIRDKYADARKAIDIEKPNIRKKLESAVKEGMEGNFA